MSAAIDAVEAGLAAGFGADWMRQRLSSQAVSIKECAPPKDRGLLVWISDPEVSIYFFPTVARWDGRQWWAGTPGKYQDLAAARWTVTHWMEIPA